MNERPVFDPMTLYPIVIRLRELGEDDAANQIEKAAAELRYLRACYDEAEKEMPKLYKRIHELQISQHRAATA